MTYTYFFFTVPIPGFAAGSPGLNEIQLDEVQHSFGQAVKNAYGLNMFAFVCLVACFVIGIDNLNMKVVLV